MSAAFTKSKHWTALVPDRASQDRSLADRLLAAEAMQLFIRLDRGLMEARAQWNQDWFRRVMHARSKAVSRLRRRWQA